MRDIWKAGIFGAVAGDALGCPVQFESRDKVATHPVTGMRGYGTFNLPAGSWTDDSSLTLALLSGIAGSSFVQPKVTNPTANTNNTLSRISILNSS